MTLPLLMVDSSMEQQVRVMIPDMNLLGNSCTPAGLVAYKVSELAADDYLLSMTWEPLVVSHHAVVFGQDGTSEKLKPEAAA